MQLVVGTRGSRLALIQTDEVLSALSRLDAPPSTNVVTIRTTGDRQPEAPLARLGKGIFIKDLEQALLDRSIDMAVHSLKDLPVDVPDGLSVVVVCRRQDPRDALVSKGDLPLAEMSPGSVIGTSSPRRAVQLRAMRSDIRVEPVRGNVETRVAKALGDDFDGVVVAAAGLARLGMEASAAQYFDPFEMVPEPGQGALAVEFRSGDDALRDMLHGIEDRAASVTATAERAFVEGMGGGCRVPIAAYGALEDGGLQMVAMAASEDGYNMVRERMRLSADDPLTAGFTLADILLAAGAAEILRAGEES